MELSLDLSLVSAPRPLSQLLSDDHLSMIYNNQSSNLSEIELYVDRLEDEKKKIDAFKRELPLCMRLLNDAIWRLREEAVRCRGANPELKEDSGADTGGSDKRNWMKSAQLWISNTKPTQSSGKEEDTGSALENLCRKSDFRDISWKGKPVEDTHPLPEICIAGSYSVSRDQTKISDGKLQTNQKKTRRRWSPELHRRFTEALKRLGGSHAATPKQIREVMKVEDLTNDEVKSHLQKYRLHLQKRQPAKQIETEIWIDEKPTGGKWNHFLCRSTSPQSHLVAARRVFSNDGESEEEEEEDDSLGRKGRVESGVDE